MKILAIEPYYGGSHKTFIDGLSKFLPIDITLLSLPARKWKWRMRLAAPYFADKVLALADNQQFDIILCSSYVDVATFRSLLPKTMSHLPLCTYLHENQFAYPVQEEDERDFHFGLTNLTTALASDRVAFNSRYNLDTFMQGVDHILKICPDMELEGVQESVLDKTSILHPGMDFSHIDKVQDQPKNEVPVIVWNHRWEHDKSPEFFFRTLFELDVQNVDFKLIVAGQSFNRQPDIFSEAHEKLKHRIIHFGYAESKDEYVTLLKKGDIVVSTAEHEFYGISIIEAVRAGCIPLLPNRLSYPELFPAEYLYEQNEFHNRLKSILVHHEEQSPSTSESLTEPFRWEILQGKYLDWFGENSPGKSA
jgi:glycosyltransferase involved in cell wall biosynthesis